MTNTISTSKITINNNTKRMQNTQDFSLDRFFNCHDLSDCTLEIIEELPTDTDQLFKVEDRTATTTHTTTYNTTTTADDVTVQLTECNKRLGKSSQEHSAKRQKLEKCISMFEQQMKDPNNNNTTNIIKRTSIFGSASSNNGGLNTNNHDTSINNGHTIENDHNNYSNNTSYNNDQKKTILFIHSLLFCSNSEYFQKLLMANVRPKNIHLSLHHGETEHFIKLVKLFYDSTPISTMSVVESTQILKFANRFQCTNVGKKLLDHISQSRIPSVKILNQCLDVFGNVGKSESSEEFTDIVVQLKKSCITFLKETFCPMEKIFGSLLGQFLALSLRAILFFLDYVTSGIAVSEETVLSLVLYWAQHTNISNIKETQNVKTLDKSETEERSDIAMKVLEHCWIEYLNGTTILMNSLPLSHPFLSQSKKFVDFYMYALEYLSCREKSSYFPDHPRRIDRRRNFAYDHESLLFFCPGTLKNGRGEYERIKRENNESYTREDKHRKQNDQNSENEHDEESNGIKNDYYRKRSVVNVDDNISVIAPRQYESVRLSEESTMILPRQYEGPKHVEENASMVSRNLENSRRADVHCNEGTKKTKTILHYKENYISRASHYDKENCIRANFFHKDISKCSEGHTAMMEFITQEPNLYFVQGYQLQLSAAVFKNSSEQQQNRELKLKLKVMNLNRCPHSNLYFSLLYAIASPSVSEHFSPWTHCSMTVESSKDHAWTLISLIADHSKITETGFYLKFYLE